MPHNLVKEWRERCEPWDGSSTDTVNRYTSGLSKDVVLSCAHQLEKALEGKVVVDRNKFELFKAQLMDCHMLIDQYQSIEWFFKENLPKEDKRKSAKCKNHYSDGSKIFPNEVNSHCPDCKKDQIIQEQRRGE